MNKRLRKKKRVGEFQEFGFEVGFRFSKGLDAEHVENIIDRFIEIAIEGNGLQFGGGGDGSEWSGFVALDKPRGSTSPHHQKALEQWFVQESEITEYYITPMIDAWYGDFDDIETEWVKKDNGD